MKITVTKVAGLPGQLTPKAPHSHWADYPDTEALYNCAQALVEHHTFPAATMTAIATTACDMGVLEATAFIQNHEPVGNKFPGCGRNSYFSNIEKSAQLLSSGAHTPTLLFALCEAIAQIGKSYRLGWEFRFNEVTR